MRTLLGKLIAPLRRAVGYIRSSETDTTAVYGEHPNGPDGNNVSGNVAGNTVSGWH